MQHVVVVVLRSDFTRMEDIEMNSVRTQCASEQPGISLSQRKLVSLLVVAAALLSALIYVSLISGPKASALAEEHAAQDILAENKQFCTSFGIVPATENYRRCSEALAAIRAKQKERDADDSFGLL